MTGPEVSACLAKVRLGDEAATRALIQYMYPIVYRLVRSNLPKRGEAEDLVQSVLIKVFKSLDQFSGTVPFHHWVSRIAVNTCLNLIRHEKSRPEVRMADLCEEEEKVVESLAVAGGNPEPGLGMAARELVQRLTACLKSGDALLIRLIYLEGMSLDEAAASTGWSAGAIAMRISRAKAKMRKRHETLAREDRS